MRCRATARCQALVAGLVVWAALLASFVASAGEPGGAVVPPGRTSTVELRLRLGPSVESRHPNAAYAQAIAADAEERWMEAAGHYQQAMADWTAEARLRPSADLMYAAHKADRERQRSRMLALLHSRTHGRELDPTTIMDRARLYRTKLMVVRAFTGAVPATLYRRTRIILTDALHAPPPSRPAMAAELRLLLCATRAAAGETEAARLELAHVPRAERESQALALPLAVCRAALGDTDQVLPLLGEIVRRLSGGAQTEVPAVLDLYVANDWDSLRGAPAFEALFPPISPSPPR